MTRKVIFSAILAVAFAGRSALASGPAPTPAPVRQVVYSTNGKYYAVSDPREETVTVFSIKQGMTDATKFWSTEDTFPNFHLSDDGEILAWMPDEYNRVELAHLTAEAMKSVPIVNFLNKSGDKAKLTLDQVIKNPQKLKATDFPRKYLWGHALGFNEDGFFVVDTLERHRFQIDPKTAKIVNDEDDNQKDDVPLSLEEDKKTAPKKRRGSKHPQPSPGIQAAPPTNSE